MDDDLKLLAGIPIIAEPGICSVTPLKLREIAAMGLEEYYKRINLLALSENDVQEILSKLNMPQLEMFSITGYDFIVENCLQNHNFYDEFKSAMRMVINESISIHEFNDENYIIVGNPADHRMFDKDTFAAFQNIIRAQNNMEIEQPLSDFERKMKEKFDKKRKLLNEVKEREGKDKDDISFADLISSVAANCNGINIINVWDLTMYSFNDQFKRMQMVEEYQNGMDLICAGADPKKIKLKHYIRNILDTK